MTHKFTVMIQGQLFTYSNYEDIPEDFEHVIEFSPEIPQGPHTEEQHNEMLHWNEKLQLLITKENNKFANS